MKYPDLYRTILFGSICPMQYKNVKPLTTPAVFRQERFYHHQVILTWKREKNIHKQTEGLDIKFSSNSINPNNMYTFCQIISNGEENTLYTFFYSNNWFYWFVVENWKQVIAINLKTRQ